MSGNTSGCQVCEHNSRAAKTFFFLLHLHLKRAQSLPFIIYVYIHVSIYLDIFICITYADIWWFKCTLVMKQLVFGLTHLFLKCVGWGFRFTHLAFFVLWRGRCASVSTC